MIKETEIEQLARFAKAFSHPIRIEIIKYLYKQNFCFTGDLVNILPIAQSTVSQHIKELKNAKLIKGEVNLPKVKYCLNKEVCEEAKKLFCKFLEINPD